MQVRFWGTRGSLPKPGPSALRYGGNTSCVEVRADDGTLIVLDCGTGAHGLGQALLAGSAEPPNGNLLITHTHWDHIQGFPFFAPLFVPGANWRIFAPGGGGGDLQATLAGQMEYSYFPVTLDQLAADIQYHDLTEGSFDVGPFHVTAQYLNHPALTLGYRITLGDATIVYSTDHEPHSQHQADAHDAVQAGRLVHLEDRRHVDFLAGADLVIHDSQYTAKEYPKKVGWGHSTLEYAVDVGLAAGVPRLALFHHDPLRDDGGVDQAGANGQERASGSMEVFGAAEGMVINLPEGQSGGRRTQADIGPAIMTSQQQQPGEQTVLIVDDDPDVRQILLATLRRDGYRLVFGVDGDQAIRLAHQEQPALILLDWQMPPPNGIEVCRLLRADPDPGLRSVPIVMLTAEDSVSHTEAGFAAGATDFVTKPFSAAHVRTRVRGWLQRARQGL